MRTDRAKAVRTTWLALAFAVVVIAPSPTQAGPEPKVGDEIAVGKNATGEECRLRLASSTQARVPTQRFALLCEGWKVASGELRRARAVKDADAGDVLGDEAWPAAWTERLAACGPVEKTSLLGSDAAALRQCRRQEGGWPLIIAAVKIKDRMYRFEGLPTNLRALVRGAEILEGQAAGSITTTPGMLSSAIRRAETMLGPSGSLISVVDVGTIEDLRLLGKRYHYVGDFIASEAAQQRVLELHERLMGPNHPSSGVLITELAQEVSKQLRLAEADALFDRAHPLVTESDRSYHYIAYLLRRANHENIKGRYAAAIQYAEAGTKLLESPSKIHSITLGALYLAIANANYHLRRLDAAAIAGDRALRVFDRPAQAWESRLWWQGEAYEVLGRIQRERKDYADALRQHERAREQRWFMYGDTPRVAQSVVEMGLVHRAAGDQDKAVAAFRRAANVVGKHRWIRENIRLSFVVAQIQGLVEAGVTGPADQRAMLIADAFVVAQTPRSTLTQRAVQAMATRVAAGDAAMAAVVRSLQDSEQKRDARRAALAQELLGDPEDRDPRRQVRLRAEYETAEREANLFEERLQATFPRYAKLLGHAPVTAEVVRSLLRPHEALVLLLPTSAGTFVFVVNANDVHVHRAVTTASQLQRRVRSLRTGLELTSGLLPVFDTAAAHQLYQELLAPLRDKLTDVRHLIAVPAGPLLDLPLGVLVTRPMPGPPADGDYRPVAWLGREFAISVLPAAAALRDLRTVAKPSAATRSFLGFGNPDFKGIGGVSPASSTSDPTCRGDQGWDRAALQNLRRLPETAEELRVMARALGAGSEDVVLGADATEARVRRADLAHYRVLAFATHGLLPGEVRCQAEPALALTPGSADRSDDGLLEASEVATLRLDAEWVVLSACNTAGRDGLGGDSLSGLTRAFFYAGARSVLASLWAVASHPTVTLTTGTVTSKVREPGLMRAEALRRSAMVLAADAATSHPFFWAPFILVGDGGS